VDTLSYKTISANKATVNKEWVIIDAEGAILGRLASEVAQLLRGKHKPNFTPHVDCGDNVIVINAEKVKLTGNKWEQREHFSYSGHPGGQKRTTPQEIIDKNPIKLVEQAVKGMLPKNKLGRALYKNLHAFEGPEHSHEAQQPTQIKIN
jgi:large subunit ribosomal protein L13